MAMKARPTKVEFLFFCSSAPLPKFWGNFQSEYGLRLAKKEFLPKIEAEIRPLERRGALFQGKLA